MSQVDRRTTTVILQPPRTPGERPPKRAEASFSIKVTTPVTLRTGNEVSADEFRELFERVSNWGRWGPDDERGALNYLTPERVAEAAGLVRSGRTVSLSRPLNTEREPEDPNPPITTGRCSAPRTTPTVSPSPRTTSVSTTTTTHTAISTPSATFPMTAPFTTGGRRLGVGHRCSGRDGRGSEGRT